MNRGVGIFWFFLATAAFAGFKATERYEGWQLTAGTKVTTHATYADCVAAAKALGAGSYKCKDVTALVIETTCEDVPKPITKLLVNAEGFTVQPGLVVEELPDGTWGPTMREDFVPAPYPACWKPGLVKYTGDFPAEEGPPTLEPGPWVYCVDYGTAAKPPIGKACPAAALGGCYIPPNAPDVCPVAP